MQIYESKNQTTTTTTTPPPPPPPTSTAHTVASQGLSVSDAKHAPLLAELKACCVNVASLQKMSAEMHAALLSTLKDPNNVPVCGITLDDVVVSAVKKRDNKQKPKKRRTAWWVIVVVVVVVITGHAAQNQTRNGLCVSIKSANRENACLYLYKKRIGNQDIIICSFYDTAWSWTGSVVCIFRQHRQSM